MPTGTVKWFDANKGYGFIAIAGGGRDAFVHITALRKPGLADLAEGQKLDFDLSTERGKEVATNLRKV
jgi:cold shock protein